MSRCTELATITTSAGQTITVDAADLVELSVHTWSVGGNGYAQRFIPRPSQTAVGVLMHRQLLGLQPGDGLHGDHINGDTLDNRRANLRVLTRQQNLANRASTASSGHRGVHRTRSGRYEARGKHDGIKHHLGTYDTPEQAAAVAHAWRLAHLPGYITDRRATAR